MTAVFNPDDFAATPPVSIAEWQAFVAAMSKLAARVGAIEEAIRQANVLALVGSNIAPLVFAAARLFDVPPEHIVGRVSTTRARLARQAVTWVGRDVFGRTSPEIGRVLRRDHTIILDYERAARALRDSDKTFLALTEELATFARAGGAVAIGNSLPPNFAAEFGRAPSTGGQDHGG